LNAATQRTAASSCGELFRVFYHVTSDTVEVLAIIAKSKAESWLSRFGNPE